jgi:hypothetical protein
MVQEKYVPLMSEAGSLMYWKCLSVWIMVFSVLCSPAKQSNAKIKYLFWCTGDDMYEVSRPWIKIFHSVGLVRDNFSVLSVALSENESKSASRHCAGTLTLAKLQLSLWNLNNHVTHHSSDGIVIRHVAMYGLSYSGRFVKNTKTDYSLNNERNFIKFVWYAYLVRINDISYDFFIWSFFLSESKSASRHCGCFNLSKDTACYETLTLPITRAWMGDCYFNLWFVL